MFSAIEVPEYIVHRQWMQRAIALAQAAGEAGEVPVGAVIIDSSGNIIAEAENRRERDNDPTAHAEIVALRQAGKTLQNWHLDRCTLYVTLEPCPMCAGAIVQARIGLLVYGADDPKTGAIRTVTNIPDSACSYHRLPVLGGILESTCRQQLQAWFRSKRGSRESGDKGGKGEKRASGAEGATTNSQFTIHNSQFTIHRTTH